MDNKILLVLCFLSIVVLINGHGMVLNPVNRASRWRFDETAPVNFEDNELFCGGFQVQWEENHGKCGLCGDNWALAKPRRNELGGEFGEGIIVQNYTQNSVIPIAVLITANHRGHFVFHLCNMDNDTESDQCFAKYRLRTIDGLDKYILPSEETGWYNTTLLIPQNLTCDHCILQWTYITGNSWGICDKKTGYGEVGCGPQENFRTCSDITIYNPDDEIDWTEIEEIPEEIDNNSVEKQF